MTICLTWLNNWMLVSDTYAENYRCCYQYHYCYCYISHYLTTMFESSLTSTTSMFEVPTISLNTDKTVLVKASCNGMFICQFALQYHMWHRFYRRHVYDLEWRKCKKVWHRSITLEFTICLYLFCSGADGCLSLTCMFLRIRHPLRKENKICLES